MSNFIRQLLRKPSMRPSKEVAHSPSEQAGNWLDGLVERRSRGIAQRTSRRGFLSALGVAVVGAGSLPLLPVARGATATADGVPAQSTGKPGGPRRPDKLRLLALLRHRRLPVQLLRRLAKRLPAWHGDVPHHLDRHLPKPSGRQELRHFLQRLLRQEQLRPLPMQPQRGRPPRLSPPSQQRHQLVHGHQVQRLPLLHRSHHRPRLDSASG